MTKFYTQCIPQLTDTSRLTVASREAKKKQQAHVLQDHMATTVSNLHAQQQRIGLIMIVWWPFSHE